MMVTNFLPNWFQKADLAKIPIWIDSGHQGKNKKTLEVPKWNQNGVLHGSILGTFRLLCM